jgi:Protein of unknown function (DUF2778)
MAKLGGRAIRFGIAAMFLTFVLKSGGTQAGPADIGSPGSGISVFGTIHPEIFRLRAPLGAAPLPERVQVASLEPQIGVDVASASFDDRFSAAMPVLASGLRSVPERDAQSARRDAPKPMLASAPVFPAPRKEIALPGDDGHTAIYDITAHTVYLPSGRRLEAHSGLGGMMDNPRHVHLRMRGPTPPNVYNLALREQIFHGVRAIRLKPVDNGRMHGRDGILAHTYMLGSNGQSNGCVAFRNYPEFLDAFRKGEVARLAVVDRLESPPGKLAAGQLPERVKELMKATDPDRKYATASVH